MELTTYNIMHYIFHKQIYEDINIQDSSEIVKSLIEAGFKIDQINLAFNHLGFVLNMEDDDFNEEFELNQLTLDTMGFPIESMNSVVEKLIGLTVLFRETNLIDDTIVDKVFSEMKQNAGDLEQPDAVIRILDLFFGKDLLLDNLDNLFLFLPMALNYRKIF